MKTILKKGLRALLLAALPACCYNDAAAQSADFFKTDYANQVGTGLSVTKAPGGSVYFSGWVCQDINCTNRDGLIVKTNAAGETIWTKNIGAANFTEQAFKVLLAGPNRLLVAGVANNNSGGGAFLYNLDTNGAVVWQVTYPVTGKFTAIVDMKLLSDGIALCGTITDLPTNNTDAWLLKTDLNGNMLWHKSYGGARYDDAWQIEHTAEGGFLLGGGSYTYRTGSSHDDAWIIKTDSLGEEIWIKHFGNADTVDWMWSMVPVGNELAPEGYIFTGVKNRSEADLISDMYLARVDTAGNMVWEIPVTSPLGFIEGMAIERAPDNTFYVIGSELIPSPNSMAILVLHVDASGNILDTFKYSAGEFSGAVPRAAFIDAATNAYVVGQHVSSMGFVRAYMTRLSGFHDPVSVGGVAPHVASFSLSPNPATDVVTVNSKEPLRHIIVRSPGGQVMQQWKSEEKHAETLSLTGIHKGIYFLTVYTASGGTATQKLIIR